jgi:hypothetical protein
MNVKNYYHHHFVFKHYRYLFLPLCEEQLSHASSNGKSSFVYYYGFAYFNLCADNILLTAMLWSDMNFSSDVQSAALFNIRRRSVF